MEFFFHNGADGTAAQHFPYYRRPGRGLFNFVLDCSDRALTQYLSLPPEAWVKVFTRGDLNWCLQTYLILAKRGNISVGCSNKLHDGCINIIHSDQLLKIKGNARQFVVCVRADYPQRQWAHFHLVQNGRQLGSDCAYLPHWVQPGLVGRDAARQGVRTVAYAGAPIKGNLAGNLQDWQKIFEPHSITFKLLSSGSWHNLCEVDVLMALRSFDTNPHTTKPPTKLFNAWQAGIPFVGGYDSAFLEVGVPGQDYLRVRNPQEALEAVVELKENPELYQAFVARGLQKARQYSQEKIAERWEAVLQGPVQQRYEAWKRWPVYEEFRFDLMQEAGLMIHKSKQLVKRTLHATLLTKVG